MPSQKIAVNSALIQGVDGVIENYHNKNSSVSIKGFVIYSYGLAIARRWGKQMLVLDRASWNFSATTSKHLAKIERHCEFMDLPLVRVAYPNDLTSPRIERN